MTANSIFDPKSIRLNEALGNSIRHCYNSKSLPRVVSNKPTSHK